MFVVISFPSDLPNERSEISFTDTEVAEDRIQNVFDVDETRYLSYRLRSISELLCGEDDVLWG